MNAPQRKKVRLGDLLVEHQVITNDQLMAALAEQKKKGLKLGRMLISLGYIDEDKMLDFLSRQFQIPFIDLKLFKYNAETVRLLPETHARRFRAIVLDDSKEEILVGMTDPTNIFDIDEIVRILKCPIRQAVVREADLLQAIDTVYRRTDEISNLAGQLEDELSESDVDLAQMIQSQEQTDAPVVRLLQTLFEDAVQINASDIHIEPDEHVLRIRTRVDGMLQEQVMNEKRIAAAVVSRLKLIAGLNISERRLPQDGRFNMKVNKQSIDIRLSTMPTQYGESVVMRLLNQSGGILDLKQLGMPDDILTRFRKLIHQPHGIVLVTGPTGSGKTTTLYAALSELNSADKKIITVEDPVEYRLPRVNQVQVNTAIGLSFGTVLRTALRQDPDIVLIGEMRDQETVQIGLRAAMTGHFVLSTLHTNDAITTANRIVDMGAEGYLVASSLRAIIAQRLIRRICDSCSQPHVIDDHQHTWLRSIFKQDLEQSEFKFGSGCPHCNNTGYRGRIGVYELLELDAAMMDALRRNDAADFANAAHRNADYRPLAQCALDYAQQGITSLEEVMRISGESDEIMNISPTSPEIGEAPATGESTLSLVDD